MSGLHAYELTLAAAIVLLGFELLTGAFVFMSFSGALCVVAALQALSGRFAFGRDAVVFAVTAGVLLVVGRKVFRRRGDSSTAEGDVNDY